MSYTGKNDTSSTQDGSCLIQVKSIPLAHRMAHVLYTGKIDTPNTQDGSCLIQVKFIPLANRMAHVLYR
jgi:hypothetical protein